MKNLFILALLFLISACSNNSSFSTADETSTQNNGTNTNTANASTKQIPFDKNRDLLLSLFDNKPDPDDIHTMAALATLRSHPEYKAINYFAVAGTYGTQTGRYLPADKLMTMTFGESNWVDAHTDYQGALQQTVNKVIEVLTQDGDVWIQEAGQSDFSADVVRKIQKLNPQLNTQHRIHIVQHSDWNEEMTTPEDLAFVKANTDYHKIADGNIVGNGTAGFKDPNPEIWKLAFNNPEFTDIWTESKSVAMATITEKKAWPNPAIKSGGLDFSDLAEVIYIFDLVEIKTIADFFDLVYP